ncbi:Fic family protein [Legionella tucsonensis]|uniref:Protein adenylyltransferase n=1 Tax=Legionella tucsonensis TaxID=40335 RepID=A0A0W0ZTR6_9GAMM|nr:Fic/DOC family N-terminal domain-containing protein [Legionella tucsonensis]KTD72468.1 Filamentation induced by cAMP protein Fic [Legionella tucsonensis]
MNKRPHIPDTLPIGNLDWESINAYSSKASLSIARYDGTLAGMINAAVLLSPITNREAVLSSKIEGTQASLVEVLQEEAGEKFDDAKMGDIKEIRNYRHALLLAEEYILQRPISLQLIRQLHEVLMEDVRGGDKTPGAFRKEQNWIGKKGTPIEQARYIPPEITIMKEALDNLEQFVRSDYQDPLVQLAIIHAQFEIIHPFLDGNGRLGRMLIPLFLYQKGVLQRPMFYLSEYLEANDSLYRDKLLAVTEQGDWLSWIQFFLAAIYEQSEQNIKKAKSIHALYDRMKAEFSTATNSQYAIAILDTFFAKPIINASDVAKNSGIENRGTANTLLKLLDSHQLIKQIKPSQGRNPAIYAFPSLLNIAEGKKIF